MFSITSRSRHPITENIKSRSASKPDQLDRVARVQSIISNLRSLSIECLSANPFRSFASQTKRPSLPQELQLVYSLKGTSTEASNG